MCGRFTLAHGRDAVAIAFQLAEMPPLEPRYNIAPSQPLLAVVWDDTRQCRYAAHLLWGLIPSWAKDPSVGRRMINARAETVAEKPSFRSSFKRRRCLIPADGFYEWKQIPSTQKGKKPIKQPFYIQPQCAGPPLSQISSEQASFDFEQASLEQPSGGSTVVVGDASKRASSTLASSHISQSINNQSITQSTNRTISHNPSIQGQLFAFAGLWDHWQGSDGSEIYSCTLLTMAANSTMSSIHHRMPVILQPQHWQSWLSPGQCGAPSLQPLLSTSDAIALNLTPVSSAVNRVGYDQPDCITPLPSSPGGNSGAE